MGNNSFSNAFQVASTGALQTWGAKYESALVAAGLTKVYSSDTWGAVTWPGTTGATWMTEVWEFASPEVGSTALFLKVAYSARAGSTSTPRLVFTAATEHAGGGTMGGQTVSADTASSATTGTGTAHSTLVAGDGHGVVIAHNYTAGAANGNFALVVDRFRRADGTAAPTPGFPYAGAALLFTAGGSARSWGVVDPVAGATATGLAWPVIGPIGALITSTSRATTAGKCAFWPISPPSRQGGHHLKMALAYPQADYPLLATASVAHLGAPRSYRTMQAAYSAFDWSARTGAALAIWWSD